VARAADGCNHEPRCTHLSASSTKRLLSSGARAATHRPATLLGVPLLLELAAPVVLAYGFARKEAPERPKVRRRKVKRALRKPASPSAKASAQPPLKLVAANDH
jgi:hypothetical protein